MLLQFSTLVLGIQEVSKKWALLGQLLSELANPTLQLLLVPSVSLINCLDRDYGNSALQQPYISSNLKKQKRCLEKFAGIKLCWSQPVVFNFPIS